MPIQQIQLSNTFNQFRLAYNDVANGVTNVEASVLSFTSGSSAIYANTIQVATLNTSGGKVLISGAPVSGSGAFIQDDSDLSFVTANNTLVIGGSLITTNVTSTGTSTFGSSNTTTISSNGNILASDRIDGYHIHSTAHIGSGGNIEDWATSKGDSAETHKIFAVSNTDSAVDMMIVNENEGGNAYAEFIAIHATGNTVDGWVAVGINSSNYNQSRYAITKADDAYLLYSAPANTSASGDLIIGTSNNGTGNKIIFSAEGFDDPANNSQLTIDPGYRVFVNMNTESVNTTTGALVVDGGIGLQGNLNVGGNVAITGTITLGGSGNTVSLSTLQVDSPIVFLGANNAADVLDLGVVGEYTSSGTKYAGLVRDASDSGIFKLFSDVTTEPANTVDFTSALYSTLQVGGLKAVDTTQSTSNTTGALIVSGGAGIEKNLYIGGIANIANTTTSSSSTTGALIVGGGVGVAENLNVGGTLSVTGLATFTGGLRVAELIEDLIDSSQAGNAITLDYTQGNVFYQSGSTFGANFTVNITNAPTDNGRAFTVSLFVPQGSTGYIPTTLNVNGSAVTIKWPGGTAPTPTSSSGKIDIFSFTIYRRSSTFFSLVNSVLNF